MMTRKIALACLGTLALGVMISACGDDDETTATTTTTSSSSSAGGSTSSSGGSTSSSGGGGGGGGVPAPPVLGAQIDRKGRPAINTAANRAFTNDPMRNAAEDAWNADGNPAMWQANYFENVRTTLAILDSLDGVCGANSQLAFNLDPGNGLDEYKALATVLTNDWLTVNSGASTCASYLGVEAEALLSATADCGGRRPTDDVIETTYSAVAAGLISGIDDGVTARATAVTAQMNFPYLEAKND